MSLVRIVIADDHEMFRAGLKSLVAQEDGLQIVGEAKDGEELLAKLKKVKCDCVVLDLSMPNMDGLEAMEVIGENYSEMRVLVLTMQKDPDHFRQAMNSGACGYVLKDDAYDQLVKAVRTVAAGKKFISPSVSDFRLQKKTAQSTPQAGPPVDILTGREKEVLKLIANGLPNKNIARRLKISIRTAETHRANLMKKVGIRSTAGLVKYALVQDLV